MSRDSLRASSEFMHQGRDEACPAGAQGMAQGDAAAVDVDPLGGQLQVP
jgi:hypothetical protein